ncbi:pitrilysin family protein [Massilia sp. TS11]|uniref:M16 family metallopeptidase n=1 Tax=Massilia sp. TS11 TaxID=2908003 RepID=UPI001EDA4D4F|nr:pitrilysin family protein [Massilia sp. TS11]MCG2586363.1 insulinase family protein [Massilia sp. TS11]
MSRHLFAALGLAACLLAAPALADSPAFERKAYQIPYQSFTLSNGLTVIVHEDHSAPVVAVNLWYHVGSRNEVRGKTGFAHLFEHFFFNGSEHYPHGFREAMDDIGANNRNGTTNTDRTNFFEDVPVAALERTLYLESDRMGWLAANISQAMLERERGVVQNEKRQGENQPYGRVRNEIVARMYPYSHPYSWSTIGSMDDLNAASLDDVKAWYATYYGPNNAVLVLAGDTTPARARELSQKYFGAIPPGPALPRTVEWIPQLERPIRDEMEDHVPQVRVTRSYHVPGWRGADTPYLEMFARVLAGTRSARLEKRLRGLITNVSANVSDAEISGRFDISMVLREGASVAQAERELDAELAALLEKGPSAEELARQRTVLLANFARATERLGGMGGRSDVLAQSQTYGGRPDAYLDQLERAATATPEQVQAAARRWLAGANHYTMVVKPFPKLAAASTDVDRSKLPPLGEFAAVQFPAVQRARLPNGLQVVLAERHGAPIVNASLVLDAGLAADSADKAGLAALTLEALERGSARRNGFQLAEALEDLGARLSSASTPDQSLLRLQATRANLGPALGILAETVLEPGLSAATIADMKKRRLAQIGQEVAQPAPLALRLLPPLLYGAGHPYANVALGTAQSMNTITREDVQAWYARWVKPGSATLIVSGDTTLAELLPQVEAAFGKWSGGSAPAKPVPAPVQHAGRTIYLIDKPDAPQSMIVAAHLSEARGGADELAMEVVMQNFGGMSTSRLNRNLRLDKHWSYGAGAQLLNVRGQRAFIVQAPVQTDKTAEAMREIAKEVRDQAGARPVRGAEFDSIMRNVQARLPARFDTLAALDGALVSSSNLGLADDYWAGYASRVGQLKEGDLARAAARYIRPEQLVWLVIGDLRKIEAPIRALNWGEIKRLGPDGLPR